MTKKEEYKKQYNLLFMEDKETYINDMFNIILSNEVL